MEDVQTMKGRDIPGWPNPDQDVLIHPKTPASVARWFFPSEEGRDPELRKALRQEIEVMMEVARRDEFEGQ